MLTDGPSSTTCTVSTGCIKCTVELDVHIITLETCWQVDAEEVAVLTCRPMAPFFRLHAMSLVHVDARRKTITAYDTFHSYLVTKICKRETQSLIIG